MKANCTLVASVLAAASTAALSSTSAAASGHRETAVNPSSHQGKAANFTKAEKFAPRFDGLRFIETLVTAHR